MIELIKDLPHQFDLIIDYIEVLFSSEIFIAGLILFVIVFILDRNRKNPSTLCNIIELFSTITTGSLACNSLVIIGTILIQITLFEICGWKALVFTAMSWSLLYITRFIAKIVIKSGKGF